MSKLKDLIKQIVDERLDKLQQESGNTDPEQGTIQSLNDDGTVNVSTGSGQYQSVGTPVVRTIGQNVVVITADGVKVAV